MGWKSTIEIIRREAINAILLSIDEMTNEELEESMYQLNIGDDLNKPYLKHI